MLSARNKPQTNRFLTNICYFDKLCLFLTFFWRGTYFEHQKLSFDFLQSKNWFLQQTLFLYSHALTIACGIQLSLISPAGHVFYQVISLFCALFWIEQTSPDVKKKCSSISVFEPFVLPIVDIFWFLCFNCSSKFSWQKITFSSCHHLVFILILLTFFSPQALSWRSDGRRQRTRHQDERVKPMVRMVTRVWKKSLFSVCFWAWPKVWVDGPESTKEKASADYVWQGLAAIVCSLWLTDLCVWHRQPARHPASEDLSSSPQVLSLHSYSLYVHSRRTTGGKIGQLEAEKLNLGGSIFCKTPCWDGHACNADGQQQKVEWNTCDCRIRKGSGHRYPVPSRSGREPSGEPIFEEEAGNGDTGISVPPLARAMTKEGKIQNCVVDTWTQQNQKSSCTGRTSCTFEQKMAWAKVATDELGRSSGLCRRSKEDRGKATEWLHGVTAAFVNYEEHKRDHREKLKLMSNKAWARNQSNDTARKNLPNHWSEVDAPLQCFGMEIESLVPQIQCIAVCDGKTISLNLGCSETVEVPKSAIQRLGGQCPYRDAEVFLSPFKKKKKAWLNPPESVVKNQIACAVNIVLCELRFGRKPRSMSSHLHHVLFSFNPL